MSKLLDCTLYDLLLLARLLRYRPEIKQCQNHVASDLVDKWVAEQRKALCEYFPRVESLLASLFHPDSNHHYRPRISWNQKVAFTKFPENYFGTMEVTEITDVDIENGWRNFAPLQTSIQEGRYPLEFRPDLPEIPIARVPAKLSPSRGCMNIWEHYNRHHSFRQLLDKYIECYLTKTRGEDDNRNNNQHRQYGVRIDFNRLHDAALAVRSGRNIRVFHQKRRERLADYRAEQHFGVLGVDINCLYAESFREVKLNSALLVVMTKFMEVMNMDFTILAFRDRLCQLDNGREVYLHMPYVIKDLNEEMSSMVWAKMEMAWHYDAGRGTHVSFPPLQLETMAGYIDRAVQQADYKFFNLFYFNMHGIGPKYETPEKLKRTARAVERVYDDLEMRYGGHWYYYGTLCHKLWRYIENKARLSDVSLLNTETWKTKKKE